MNKSYQQLLGIDKKNPVFSLSVNPHTNQIHCYYGLDLLEIVPNDKKHIAYKHLAGRLYNAGINLKKLCSVFGFDPRTIKKYGKAVLSDTPEEMIKILMGQEYHRKLTYEIQGYIKARFLKIIKTHPRSYNLEMRKEIYDVFEKKLSAETIRPLLKELKLKMKEESLQEKEEDLDCKCLPEANKKNEVDVFKREGVFQGKQHLDCEFPQESNNVNPTQDLEIEDGMNINNLKHEDSDHKSNVVSQKSKPLYFLEYCYHLGLLLFSPILNKIEKVNPKGWILKQWLSTILLGMINIEQTKLIHFDDLETLIGRSIKDTGYQRKHLKNLADDSLMKDLLGFNFNLVKSQEESDFYYDPHTKQYTGINKILKGWCGSKHKVDKAMHMDMIHTSKGHPVYIHHCDNYYDLRDRFFDQVNLFRNLFKEPDKQTITMIVDRGIFGKNIFNKIKDEPNLHLITWEKNYKPNNFKKEDASEQFQMTRLRNNSTDVLFYSFIYQDAKWSKDSDLRLIRVQATNPKGRTIELGILTDDLIRPAKEIICLMLKRWIQENDFKYLEKHFGINQIISYLTITYEKYKKQLRDKEMKSGEYKALEKELKEIKKGLKDLLYREHNAVKKNSKRTKKIDTLTQDKNNVCNKMQETEQNISRLDFLIQANYKIFNFQNKKIMDLLKIIARNAFYQLLEPFRKCYDNFRDDHVLLRNLTHTSGVIQFYENEIKCFLIPTVQYQPEIKKIVQQFLQQINQTNYIMPDGSNRKISFTLSEKSAFKLAFNL